PGACLLLLRDLDLAALRLAFVGGGFGEALAMAAVLALAGVVGALASARALARIDAFTLHAIAGLLRRLVLRQRCARSKHRGDCGGEDRVPHRHGAPPEGESGLPPWIRRGPRSVTRAPAGDKHCFRSGGDCYEAVAGVIASCLWVAGAVRRARQKDEIAITASRTAMS